MSVQIETKAAVTVAEMARMFGMSRARFYQLQKAGVFPTPVYDVSNSASNLCTEEAAKGLSGSAPPKLRDQWQAGPLLRQEQHESRRCQKPRKRNPRQTMPT